MSKKLKPSSDDYTIDDFLNGKSQHTIDLYNHFVKQFSRVGKITIHPAKTMIGIATPRKRIVYITQLGKNFIHAVFPFDKPYDSNLCFQKIAKVPGDDQYNHHFRMLEKEDVNEEVMKFMKLAYEQGS
ncbi:MAG TPA: DUF5655 domain-containing protein [Cyclobacteriaceae bacterium]|nr:DUF5655 domain-containing protein [Cyclobacteriaceae bacterium]